MVKFSPKLTEVYNILKDGSPVKFDTLVSKLGCKPVSVMVLICALRRDCNADIKTIRSGRKVESYQLLNASVISGDAVFKTKGAKTANGTKTVKAKTTKPKKDVSTSDQYHVQEISDAEFADIRSQLGI